MKLPQLHLAELGDAAALTLLSVGIVLTFLPAYGPGWLWVAVLGGTALGMGIARWGKTHRLGSIGLVTIAAWLLFGTFLAMPQAGVAWFIPTPRSLLGIIRGPVTAWRDMLTVAPPLGTTSNLMCVPLLCGLANGLIGMLIAGRSRWPMFAWVPGVVGMLAGLLLGTREPLPPLPIAIATVALIVCWTSVQRGRKRRELVASSSRQRFTVVIIGALVLSVCAGLTALGSGVVAPARDRWTLRDEINRPLDVRDYASPLQGYRANFSLHRNDLIMHVSGAPGGSRVKVATLDSYDGITYNVSNGSTVETSFTRVGARILERMAGDPITTRIDVGTIAGPWVPTVGAATDVEFTGDNRLDLEESFYYNVATRTGIVTSGLGADQSYTVSGMYRHRPSDDDIRNAIAATDVDPQASEVSQRLRALATAWTGGANSAGEQATMIADRFSSTGWFSHGVDAEDTPSAPGHSRARISELIANEEQMVGDDEQYAVAMALLCRSLSIPARVVYGYEVGDDGDVHGRDARAWPQVKLEGLGWVDFDPTPSPDRILTEYDDTENPETRPHVENPPPPVQRPDQTRPDDQLTTQSADDLSNRFRVNWRMVTSVFFGVGIPLVVLVGPIVLILGLKRRRRRSREFDENVANRVAGGWAELVDAARDFGLRLSPAATRSEQAAKLKGAYREIDAWVLAQQADAAAFSPDPVSTQQAAGYWQRIDEAMGAMKTSVKRYRAWLARLSTRSFRLFEGGRRGRSGE